MRNPTNINALTRAKAFQLSISWNITEGAQIADAEVQVGRPVDR